MTDLPVAALFGLIAATMCIVMARRQSRAIGLPLAAPWVYAVAYAIAVPVIGGFYWYLTG